MSRWNRPMRVWRPMDQLRCAACGKKFSDESWPVMDGPDLFHSLCVGGFRASDLRELARREGEADREVVGEWTR